MAELYGYRCEYCDGTVRERIVEREAFKHVSWFVILERVPIGVCDRCGNRYYHASVLRRVDQIATGQALPERTGPVPVAAASG